MAMAPVAPAVPPAPVTFMVQGFPGQDPGAPTLGPLRRFGAGMKVLTIVTFEKYTAYREEVVTESTASTFSMSLDGGVGGVVY